MAICAGLASLGGWQLERLAGRRARSARLASRLTAPPVVLTAATFAGGENQAELAYRQAVVRGTFDYSQEIALINQVWKGRLGFHLLTPLVLEGSDLAVPVDRGWVPAPPVPTPLAAAPWAEYRAPAAGGPVEVRGWIRPDQGAGGHGGQAGRDGLVSNLDLAGLQAQVTHPLLPVVVVQLPDAGAAGGGVQGVLPYRRPPNPDLGEGVHLIAAVQWFAFSLIGAAGYIIYLSRQMPLPAAPPSSAPSLRPP